MGNNPILHNDRQGDIFGIDNIVGAVIGATIEAGTQMAVNAMTNKDLFDLDYADIGAEAIVGFATSGVGNVAKAGKTAQRLIKATHVANKAVNSNKAVRTVVKVSKATGAGKNAIKAGIDVKKEGVKTIGHGKEGKEIAVDFVAGIAGDGVAKVGNVLVTDKAVRTAKHAVTKANRGIPGTAAQKAYKQTASNLKARAAVKGGPASILSGAASGGKSEDVKRKIKSN
jgi:hypothetical protein